MTLELFGNVTYNNCTLTLSIHWSSDIPDEKGISDKKSNAKPPDVLDQKAWMSGLKTTSCVGSEDCMDDTPIQ